MTRSNRALIIIIPDFEQTGTAAHRDHRLKRMGGQGENTVGGGGREITDSNGWEARAKTLSRGKRNHREREREGGRERECEKKVLEFASERERKRLSISVHI